MKLEYIVTNKLDLKRILKEDLAISDRLYRKIKADRIYINNSLYNPLIDLHFGDIITIDLDFYEIQENIISNSEINFNILYEDEWLLIVDKPPFVPVHPSINYYKTSLSNGIMNYYLKNNIHKKVRPVNRLDRNTSGIVIFAKSEYIQEQLIKQMKNHTFIKEYIAVVKGQILKDGIIDAPISRRLPSIIEREVSKEGEYALTKYWVIKNFADYTLVKCQLLTGRTHQIRVHMKYIGHPIIGDSLYGTEANIIKRQALHAYHITFIHPVSKNTIDIISNTPDDINRLIL